MMTTHILVIDDDRALRLLYERELGEEGYAVATAGSGEEGLRLVQQEDFDLIILDIEMPEMSGLQALHRIRAMAPAPRVIINSAYSTYRADFQSWLADDYLVKSSDLGPLKEKIRQLLDTP